jgi:hypothetical protein
MGIIDHHLREKILAITSVRNKLAHRWDEKEVFYGKDASGTLISIVDNIDKFKKDSSEVWTNLVELYMNEEDNQIGHLMAILGRYDLNTLPGVYEEIMRIPSRREQE